MYTIRRDHQGVFFACEHCDHVERVRNFDITLGSQRTQAAQAMNHHLETHQDVRLTCMRQMAMAMERG